MTSMRFFAFVCLALMSSCGVDIEAASSCHELADLGCTLTSNCGRGDKYACITGYNVSVSRAGGTSCQDAKGIRSAADFEACASGLRVQIASSSCDAPRPSTCTGVILFE